MSHGPAPICSHKSWTRKKCANLVPDELTLRFAVMVQPVNSDAERMANVATFCWRTGSVCRWRKRRQFKFEFATNGLASAWESGQGALA